MKKSLRLHLHLHLRLALVISLLLLLFLFLFYCSPVPFSFSSLPFTIPSSVPQSFAPVPQSFAPVPQSFAPAPQPFAHVPKQFAPAPQPFAPVPQPFAPAPSSATNPAFSFFRNAPWKSAVGRWLSACYNHDSNTASLTETAFGRLCPNNCSNNGICNHAEGQCRCFHGFGGLGCEDMLNLECNLDATTELPYGSWIVSMCPAFCDKRRAMCFCGNGTKYPERPVAEACGFSINGAEVDWAKQDWDNVFSNSTNQIGWCNVDPSQGYQGKIHSKHQCDCKYDCRGGRFCEKAIECFCLNQCSGNGVCKGGFCQCTEGWYGVDCSIPSYQIETKNLPNWLGSISSLPQDTSVTQSFTARATVKKKHPLIYVYDLPPQFNIHLLEGRHWKLECVNRLYDDENATIWTSQLYGAEIALYENLLASPHRTTNGEEADFFYVPVLGACLIARGDETPHLSMKNFRGFRSYFALDLYRQAYEHISQSYPFWNRTDGRDHIWFFSWDEGACFAPKQIWNSMMLVHWGNTNEKYNYSTTGYFPDNWNYIPIAERGNHVCFDPKKDLVLPAWKTPDAGLIFARLWQWPLRRRKTLFYFNGNLGRDFEYGRPEPSYSMGIRQKLAREFSSSPNKYGALGKQFAKDVIVANIRSEKYAEDLASSKFCGVLPGDGWSGRMEDSILHGCIPVIIQDGVQLIYENVLDYNQFTVRIKEEEIPHLVDILRNITDAEVEFKLSVIRKIWQRFLYRDAVLLEAQRQKESFNRSRDWAKAFLMLTDDDAFATFIQVLHYKLYNDAWRQESAYTARQNWSLAKICKP